MPLFRKSNNILLYKEIIRLFRVISVLFESRQNGPAMSGMTQIAGAFGRAGGFLYDFGDDNAFIPRCGDVLADQWALA